MQILAVYPEYQEQLVFDPMPPLGLASIAATLRAHGHSVRIVDEQVEKVDIGAVAAEMRPSIILIGGTSHSRFHAFRCAASVRAAYPQATIVYGGPHASFTADDTLSHVPAIDIVAHGEGEATVLELVQWKEARSEYRELEKIQGITFRQNGCVVSTGWRPPNQNLDALPPPARDLLAIDRYKMTLDYLNLPALHIVTARGCPYKCTFCSAARMFNNRYVMRSPEKVVDEVASLVERYHIKGLKIFDSTFTINKNHVYGFCDELARRGLTMPWECEIRVDSVDRALLERMRSAGCYYVDIGIESADQCVLDTMKKSITMSDAEQLLRWCEELELRTKVFFTVGHISETYHAGLKTVRFIRRNRKRMTLVGYNPGIRVYPGTDVEDYARCHNLLPPGFRWSGEYENRDNARIYLAVNNIPLLLQPQMGIRELRKLRHRYILSRVASPAFLKDKLSLLLKHKEVKKYASLGLRGVLGRNGLKG